MRSGSPYLRALANPGALRFSAAGLLGRWQISMFGLGTVLLVSSLTGRNGLAGAVAAAGAAGYALVSPLVARLADRLGQRAVLRPLMGEFAAATTALITGAQAHAPAWALLAASGLAGAATPQLGSMVRKRWSAPLAAQPATEPLAHPACAAGSLRSPGVGRRARRPLLPAPGLVTLAPVFLFFGAMLAAIDLATVDFAQQHGHKPLAGFILGGYALGSAAGGLWYGSRTWQSPLRRRFALTLGAAATGTVTFSVMPGLAALAAVMSCAGLPLSAIMISGFSLIERQAPAGRQTEGMAWLTSAMSVGTAVGSACAGQAIDTGGARYGYIFAAACAAAAVLACLAGLHHLGAPSTEPSLAPAPAATRNGPADAAPIA